MSFHYWCSVFVILITISASDSVYGYGTAYDLSDIAQNNGTIIVGDLSFNNFTYSCAAVGYAVGCPSNSSPLLAAEVNENGFTGLHFYSGLGTFGSNGERASLDLNLGYDVTVLKPDFLLNAMQGRLEGALDANSSLNLVVLGSPYNPDFLDLSADATNGSIYGIPISALDVANTAPVKVLHVYAELRLRSPTYMADYYGLAPNPTVANITSYDIAFSLAPAVRIFEGDGLGLGSSIPEPSTMLLLGSGLLGLLAWRQISCTV